MIGVYRYYVRMFLLIDLTTLCDWWNDWIDW